MQSTSVQNDMFTPCSPFQCSRHENMPWLSALIKTLCLNLYPGKINIKTLNLSHYACACFEFFKWSELCLFRAHTNTVGLTTLRFRHCHCLKSYCCRKNPFLEIHWILCLCVRHEHFVKTSKISGVNFWLLDKQLIIHSTQTKPFKIVFNSYQSI